MDGIIVSFTEANQDELYKLKEENFPSVQIYRKSSNSILPTIVIDNVASAYNAVKYLLNHGHRMIGHITTGEQTISGMERLEGYRKAMSEAGIDVKDEWIQVCVHSVEGAEKPLREFLTVIPR